jgi:hypothetical protein
MKFIGRACGLARPRLRVRGGRVCAPVEHYDPITVIDALPFTDPANTEHDAAVMRDMLGRMRAFARGWLESPPPGPGALVREADAAGNRTWIRVPDRDALLAAGELTTVGFFGQARADVDHDPIHRLEEAIVDTLELVPGVLSYFDLALAHGVYGNLILCDSPDAAVRWHEHDIHAEAVELAPRHYHSARIHNGVVHSPLLGDADLVVLRTRFYDFDDN